MKIENANFDSSDLSSCEEVCIEDDKSTVLDQDHRLLLRNAKPLFQSRNAAVHIYKKFNKIQKKKKMFYLTCLNCMFNLLGCYECCSVISSFGTKIRGQCNC